MNINKYTEKAREGVAAAIELARAGNNPQLEPEHPGIALALNNVTGQQGLQQLRDRLVDFCVGPILDTPADIASPVVRRDMSPRSWRIFSAAIRRM